MATDVNAAKSALVTDSAIPSAKTAAQNSKSGIDFSDIIRKSGNRLENGLNLFSDRAGITGVEERTDNTPSADDYSYDENYTRNDDTRNRTDTDDHTDHGQEYDVSDDPHYTSDYDNDGTQDYKPEMTAASSDKQADNKNHSENTQDNDRRDKTGGSFRQESSDDSTVELTNSNEPSKTNGADGSEKNGNKAILSPLIAGTQADSSSDQVRSQDYKQNSILPGETTEQTNTITQNSMGEKNLAAGFNIDMANTSMKTSSNSASTGQSSTSPQNTQAQAHGHNLSNTQGQAQVQNSNSAELQAASETQGNISSKASEQAAQLSKMIAGGKKVDVSVTVTDEKSTLISKPTASLISNTVLAADATTASLRSQQGKGVINGNANGQAQQITGQIAGAPGQAQQTVGAQAQSSNAASNNIKGATQASPHAVGTQGNLSGNGETPVAAAPNSVSAAQQAQQNTSTQAANVTRFTTVNHAVAEQVSVQITKALNAGNDRISIQLKPADLGRVDVQMEVSQDGRVTAVVTADNKQTLDLLQKDSRQLQEALHQAGLKADDDSLNFNLREQDDSQEMAESDSHIGNEDAGDELTLEEELAGIKPNIITDTRVDVQA